MIGANFFVEVNALLRKPLPDFIQLAVVQCILDPDGNLVRHLAKKFQLFRGEGVLLHFAHVQRAQGALWLISGRKQPDFKPAATRGLMRGAKREKSLPLEQQRLAGFDDFA